MKPRREEPPKQEAAKVEAVTPAEVKSEAVAAKKEAPVKKNAAAAQKSVAAAPAKKASGQNNPGFFGRMFGKKKK